MGDTVSRVNSDKELFDLDKLDLQIIIPKTPYTVSTGSIPYRDVYFFLFWNFRLLPVPHSSAELMQMKLSMTIHL